MRLMRNVGGSCELSLTNLRAHICYLSFSFLKCNSTPYDLDVVAFEHQEYRSFYHKQ
jgi:hypothetical protein